MRQIVEKPSLDYLYHYGVKGMKWGVRKAGKETGFFNSINSKQQNKVLNSEVFREEQTKKREKILKSLEGKKGFLAAVRRSWNQSRVDYQKRIERDADDFMKTSMFANILSDQVRTGKTLVESKRMSTLLARNTIRNNIVELRDSYGNRVIAGFGNESLSQKTKKSKKRSASQGLADYINSSVSLNESARLSQQAALDLQQQMFLQQQSFGMGF